MRITIGSLQAEIETLKNNIRELQVKLEAEQKAYKQEVSNKDYYYRQSCEKDNEIRAVRDFLKLIPGQAAIKDDVIDALPLISRIGLWLATTSIGK